MPTYLDSSDDDDLEENPAVETASKEFVNDVDGLSEKLKEFQWPLSSTFTDHQTLESEAPVSVEDVNDDLERELAFYNQATSAAKSAIQSFEQEGILWRRPEDYYAEMVKSDGHMNRIKDQLMFEQKRITLAEQRRKARESKKFAKQVQTAKRQEKEAAKKKKTKEIQKMRKDRKKLGFDQEFDWDMAIEEAHNQESGKPKRKAKADAVVKSGKRMYKDARYGRSGGFGSARTRKRNTEESTGDMSSFPNRGMQQRKGKQRLGKNRRLAMISKKKSRN